MPKSQRTTIEEREEVEDEQEAEEGYQRRQQERVSESKAMLQDHLTRSAAIEELPDAGAVEEVDDTDNIDEEAEFEAWKLRELQRIKRDRRGTRAV